MGEVLREASFSLAEAKFTAGDFSHMIIQNVSRAQHRVRTRKENVVGLFFNIFYYFKSVLIDRWFVSSPSRFYNDNDKFTHI